MTIIPINLPSSSKTAGKYHPLPPCLATLGSEIVLLELQGSLEVEGDRSEGHVGKLVMKKDGKISLRIGIHLLEGKIANLPKPLAVLARSTPSATTGRREADGDDSDPDGASPRTTAASFDMVTIVKKKVVFSRRPVPLVGKGSTVAGAKAS